MLCHTIRTALFDLFLEVKNRKIDNIVDKNKVYNLLPCFITYFFISGAPDSGFYYPARYRISRIVENYPAGLFGRIVVM